MIGPLIGPETTKTPHGRLLYKAVTDLKGLGDLIPGVLAEIDQLIDAHPNLHYANSDLQITFFGSEAKVVWVGREIIGHLSKAPEGFGTFDTYAGECFSWKLASEKDNLLWAYEELLNIADSCRSLAPAALATTWRIVLGPLSEKQTGNMIEKPQFTFQFFKNS